MQEMENEGLTGIGLEAATPLRGALGRLHPRTPPFKPKNPVMTQAAERALSAIADTPRDLTKQLRIPKSEPEKFYGDETKFREFLIDFEECVAKWADNDRERLTLLRAFTTGTPHGLVRGCVHFVTGGGLRRGQKTIRDEIWRTT